MKRKRKATRKPARRKKSVARTKNADFGTRYSPPWKTSDVKRWTSQPSGSYQIRSPSIEHDGPPLSPGPAKGNCVLLHGWNDDASDMVALRDELQSLPAAHNWAFHRVTYETHFVPFTVAAKDVLPLIKNLANLVLVGYSMGGIVARQMVAKGLRVKAAVTSCSPHHGLGVWIPPVDSGVASLRMGSRELWALNRDRIDAAARKTYHCFGVYFRDAIALHPDDGVVPLPSALGASLGIPNQQSIFLKYDGHIGCVDPHLRGKNPSFLDPLLSTCDTIFGA